MELRHLRYFVAVADERVVGVVRSDYHATGDPGVQIAVREVSLESPDRAKRSVLLLHGARVPGIASFDLPVAGGSLSADLAQAGHRVFIMDARGYGDSTRPAALSEPPEANPPQVRSDAVVRDVAAVIDGKVALLGWAAGGPRLLEHQLIRARTVRSIELVDATHYGHLDRPRYGRDQFLGRVTRFLAAT